MRCPNARDNLLVGLYPCLCIRLFLQLRDGGRFESVTDQLVNNPQPLLRSLKAFHSGNGLLLLSVNLLLQIGYPSFQMPLPMWMKAIAYQYLHNAGLTIVGWPRLIREGLKKEGAGGAPTPFP